MLLGHIVSPRRLPPPSPPPLLVSLLNSFSQFLFTGYGFTFPLTVALLQVVCTVPAAYAAMEHGLDNETAIKCLPLAVVHTLNMTAALAGEECS